MPLSRRDSNPLSTLRTARLSDASQDVATFAAASLIIESSERAATEKSKDSPRNDEHEESHQERVGNIAAEEAIDVIVYKAAP